MASHPQDVVDAICNYMNDDPMESNLTIVIGHTRDRSYSAARLVTFDTECATFEADRPGATDLLVIPWRSPANDRAAVREQLMALWQESLDGFGSG